MLHEIVAMVGHPITDTDELREVASEFGWKVECVNDAESLPQPGGELDIVAVIFDPVDLGLPWEEALRMMQMAAPGALPIVGVPSSQDLPWPEMADAGAFHAFHVPVSAGEMRQSLGFVWAARRQKVENVFEFRHAKLPGKQSAA